MRRLAGALLPVVGWMAVIYTLSTDLGSASHTSRILEPLLRWLYPAITSEALGIAHVVVRKAAHFIEYAILALLVVRAWRILRPARPDSWSWRVALLAALAAAGYAGTDELHQLFVRTRGASPYDVMIDAAGALGGVLVAYAWWRWRGRRTAGRSGASVS